jgi:hypothetical protein
LTAKPPHRIALLAVFAAAVVLSVVPPAFAGKGGGNGGNTGSSGSTINLVLLDSSDGLAHYGQTVTFKLNTSYSTPSVSLYCYQNGYLVAAGSHPMYLPNLWDDPGTFGLFSAAWGGGAADCRADLIGQSAKGRTQTLASLSFHVYA